VKDPRWREAMAKDIEELEHHMDCGRIASWKENYPLQVGI